MYKNILLAVDLGDEGSWTKALPVAVSLAQAYDATLHLVTVVPDFGMSIVGGYFPKDFEEKAMEAAHQHLHDFAGEHVSKDVDRRCIVAHGRPYEEIIRAADDAGCDLIVMASHRPGLEDYLLGPNAARVVRHSGKSVMVVRP